MKILRVGIIGQGRSGWNIHGATLLNKVRDRYQLVAVCDPDGDRCRDAVEAVGCAAYTDHRELLADKSLDLIVNATMSNDHGPINIEALNAGHNVLSEKPLARDVASVDRQAEAALKAGKRLFIFQQSRFAPGFVETRRVIDSGVLGDIVMVKISFNGFARRWDWQTIQGRDGGNLLNTGPHPLDQALQFFGKGEVDPERVICLMQRTDNTSGDAEDHVKLLLAGDGHPTIDMEISSCAAFSPFTYMVYGTRGGLMGTYSKLEWKYYDAAEMPSRELAPDPLPNRAYCGEQLPWYKGSWECPPEGLDFSTWAKSLYEDVYESLTTGREPTVTVDQVRRQVRVIEECHRQNPLSRLG